MVAEGACASAMPLTEDGWFGYEYVGSNSSHIEDMRTGDRAFVNDVRKVFHGAIPAVHATFWPGQPLRTLLCL